MEFLRTVHTRDGNRGMHTCTFTTKITSVCHCIQHSPPRSSTRIGNYLSPYENDVEGKFTHIYTVKVITPSSSNPNQCYKPY